MDKFRVSVFNFENYEDSRIINNIFSVIDMTENVFFDSYEELVESFYADAILFAPEIDVLPEQLTIFD